MYRATVTSTSFDGRIQVFCPPLYGAQPSGWIAAAAGIATPDIGATVWIALENNDHALPIWLPLVGTV